MNRHYIYIILLSLCSVSIAAQENVASFLQQFSVEVGSGYHLPISPHKSISINDYAGLGGCYVGVNYALNDLWGIRITYANKTFVDKNDKSNKFTIQKVMTEATFNILQSAQPQPTAFDIMAHTGVGVSLGNGHYLTDTDKMINFQIGLMPLYRITANLSIQLDATYILNFQQNQGYNGQYLYDDIRDVTGSYFLLNMGLGVRLAF